MQSTDTSTWCLFVAHDCMELIQTTKPVKTSQNKGCKSLISGIIVHFLANLLQNKQVHYGGFILLVINTFLRNFIEYLSTDK